MAGPYTASSVTRSAVGLATTCSIDDDKNKNKEQSIWFVQNVRRNSPNQLLPL
jgi:hypothetical protein